MKTLLAALLSLAVGALISWVLYGIKSKKPVPWGLALLRLSWTSLLFYALVAPPLSQKEMLKWAPSVHIVVDTSASVLGDAWAAAERVKAQLEEQGWRGLVQPLHDNLPLGEGQSWFYVGDGRVETPEWEPPIGAVFVEGNELVAAPLVQGIIAPERVVMGSDFEVVVLTNETAEITLKGSEILKKGTANDPIRVRAPRKAGPMELSVQVRNAADGRTETQPWTVIVEESEQEVVVVYTRPNEHVGMSVRAIKALGYVPYVCSWAQWEREPRSGLPTVMVGGDERHIEQLKSHKAPTLWLTAVHSQAQWKLRNVAINSRFPSWQLADQLPLAVLEQGKKNTQNWPEPPLANDEFVFDARGVAFWPSVLKNKSVLGLMQRMVEEVVQKSIPLRLKVQLPATLYKGQRASAVAFVIDTDGSLAPQFDFEVALFQNGALVARPAVQLQGGGASWTLPMLEPGRARMEVVARAPGLQLDAQRTFVVSATGVEQVRPFNRNLWAAWAREGAVLVDTDGNYSDLAALQAEPLSMVYAKEKPQHHRWWYWGLWLALAAAEWTLRRLRGLR